jgi:hypothetical protein
MHDRSSGEPEVVSAYGLTTGAKDMECTRSIVFTEAGRTTLQDSPRPPNRWGGGLPEGKLPPIPRQIDPTTGRPRHWPMRNTLVHWATLLRIERPGMYHLRCHTIDANGAAQPMPRPFLKSGHNAIQKTQILVEE